MDLTLTRQTIRGAAVKGCLRAHRTDILIGIIPTMENLAYMIAEGRYRLGLHVWTKSKRLVPILRNVPDRTGILIHNGYPYPQCSTGCILAQQPLVESLVTIIQQANKKNEEIYLTITTAPRGLQPEVNPDDDDDSKGGPR